MGKSLIIPGADFSAVALPKVGYLEITFGENNKEVQILASPNNDKTNLHVWRTVSGNSQDVVRVDLQEYFADNPTANGSNMVSKESNWFNQNTGICVYKLYVEDTFNNLTSLENMFSCYLASNRAIAPPMQIIMPTSKITDIQNLLRQRDCQFVGTIKIEFDGSLLTKISAAFAEMSGLSIVIDLSGITNFSHVTKCAALFYRNTCVTEVYMNHFIPTDALTTYSNMFTEASSLSKIYVDDATAAAWLISRLAEASITGVYDSTNKVINCTH